MPAAKLGGIYRDLEQPVLARYWWQRAIERSPGPRPDYLFQVGLTYEAENNTEKALDLYQKALSLAPRESRYQKAVKRLNAILEGK